MPSALDSIITKLLAKDRDQRYRSAEELLADLEAVSASPSSSAGARRSGEGFLRSTSADPSSAAARGPAPSPLPHDRHRRLAVGGLQPAGLLCSAITWAPSLRPNPHPARLRHHRRIQRESLGPQKTASSSPTSSTKRVTPSSIPPSTRPSACSWPSLQCSTSSASNTFARAFSI